MRGAIGVSRQGAKAQRKGIKHKGHEDHEDKHEEVQKDADFHSFMLLVCFVFEN
jgi:hypothetical protein